MHGPTRGRLLVATVSPVQREVRMNARHLVVLALAVVAALAAVVAEPARAEAEHFSVPATGFVDCRPVGGELIVLNGGTFDVVRNRTVDETGGVHFVRVFRSEGITGIGLTSGATYRLLGAALLQFTDTGETFEQTRVHRGVLLGPDGQGFALFLTIHITDNGNQDVSITIDKTECRG
jgi:hypothetical protein